MTSKRRAWAVAVVVYLAGVVIAANRFKVPPVMDVLIDDLGVDMVTGGWLMSAAMVASILLAIPGALLLGRFGLKRTGLLATGCTVAGCVVGAMAPGASTLMLGRVVEGVGNGLIAVLAPTAISFWFEERDRGLPMGIWSSWVPVGNGIIFNLAAPLLGGSGWRGLWWLGALCGVGAFALMALVVTDPPAASRQATALPLSVGRTLRSPGTWLLALCFGSFAFSLIGYSTWAPTYLSDVLRLDPAWASFYASLVFLAGIPANILVGWAASLTQRRYALLLAAFLITTVLSLWSFRLVSMPLAVFYVIVLGLASNGIPTLIFILVPQTVLNRESAGLALSAALTVSYLGAVVGPPLLGGVINGGNWAAGGPVLFAVLGLGTVAAWIAGRIAQRPSRTRFDHGR